MTGVQGQGDGAETCLTANCDPCTPRCKALHKRLAPPVAGEPSGEDGLAEVESLARVRRSLEDVISEHSGHGYGGYMRPAGVGCETYVVAWSMLALLPEGTPIAPPTTDLLAAAVEQAKREAWDEGRRFGQQHWATNYAPEVPGKRDPNPYRAASVARTGDTA